MNTYATFYVYSAFASNVSTTETKFLTELQMDWDLSQSSIS